MTADPLYEPKDLSGFGEAVQARAVLDIRHVVIDDVCPHPSAGNGIRHVVRRIAREQVAAGDNPRIIFLRRPGHDDDAEPIDIPTLTLPLDGPRFARHVVGLVPEIMSALTVCAGPGTRFHIHTARQPLLLALARELERRRLAFGVTVHGRYSHVIDRDGRVANWKSALYLRLIEQRALEKARFVQAVSPAEAGIIRRLVPRARVHVIPNAAYSSALDGVPALPRRTASFGAFPTFGYCGRYEIEHKGLDLLIDGFGLYRRAGGQGRLALMGTGPARDAVAAMVETLGITDAVELHGPCFGDEKRRRMQGWDFFVQPSRFDGVPIAALEAALAGLPLIISAETALAGHIASAGAGIAVREFSAHAIAMAFTEASTIVPDVWNGMAGNAHAMAMAIGDWTPIAESLRSLYLAA
jgi:glycosyltransferase involved in cell wall biosynthesis